jgi:hypothetical protein
MKFSKLRAISCHFKVSRQIVKDISIPKIRLIFLLMYDNLYTITYYVHDFFQGKPCGESLRASGRRPGSAMAAMEGGPQGPSYNKVASPDLGSRHFKRPPFEPPAELRNILWEEELKEKGHGSRSRTQTMQKRLAFGNLENASHRCLRPPNM